MVWQPNATSSIPGQFRFPSDFTPGLIPRQASAVAEMDFETVKAWLAQQSEKLAARCRLKGVLGLVLCPMALAWSASLVYAFLWAISRRLSQQSGSSNYCLATSLLVLPLLFIGNRLMSPADVLEDRLSDPEGRTLARFGPGRGVAELLILCWVLFTGPKLWDWAIKSFREARLWREQDTHSCAAVIWLLATRFKRVPFEDVGREIPWLDLPATLPQLARIPGVLNLKGPPPGLALTDDMRKAIRTGGDLEPVEADVQLR
jgi:hypothetical protein